MTIHTTTSTLRTQLTASIRLERMMTELAEFEAEMAIAREQCFGLLTYPEGDKLEDLDDTQRFLHYARQELEGARRSLQRVWADRKPAEAPTAMSELASSMRAAGMIPIKGENA